MITYPLIFIPFYRCSISLAITYPKSSGSPPMLNRTTSGHIFCTINIPFPAEEFFEASPIKDHQKGPNSS
jgi:hypothetical protein